MDTGQTIRILPIHPALAQFEPRRDAGALPRDVTIAIDYMRRNMARRIALSDLAQAAGTPERTMHKHFVRFVGIAPLGFLRRLRLAAAREALLTRSDSVTGIATSHGFSHFGRFAADYRRCFGETPSATRRRAAQPALPNPIVIPTLVLAPFRTSGDRESNNLAETIVEQLAAELAQGRAVSVRLARPGTHRPEGRYCLAGSVTRSAERARVILRLLDIEDERHLWGDSFEASPGEEPALLDALATRVASEVPNRILGYRIERAQRAEPARLTASELALRALPLAQSPRFEQAFDLVQRAMALAPDCALAVALAGWCRARRVTGRNSGSDEDRVAASVLADRAAVLAPGEPMVLAIRASVAHLAGQYEDAEALAWRAVALDPACAWAWDRLGWLHEATDRPDEALPFFARAERVRAPYLDAAAPLDGVGTAHFSAGRYAAAAPALRTAALLRPDSTGLHGKLAACYARLGEKAAARAAVEKLRRLLPDVSATQYANAFPCGFGSFRSTLANSLTDSGMPA